MKWIFALLILISAASYSQDDPAKYIRYQNQYGMRMPRLWSDSVLHIPYRDTNFIPAKPGAIVMRPADKKFYGYTTHWEPVGGSELNIQQVINTGNIISENDSINVAAGNTLTIHGGTGSSIILKELQSAVSHSRVVIQPGLLGLEYRNLSSGNIKSLTMSSLNGITVTDQDSQTGLGYASNYRTNGIANFGDRWIPDWGTVKDSIAAAGGGGGTDSATVLDLAYKINVANTSDSIILAGDSYTTGQGASTGNNYSKKVAATLGKQEYNVGVGGTGAYQAVKNINIALPGSNNYNAVSAMFGYNDIRRNGSATKTLAKIKNAWYSILASSFLSELSYPGNSSSITRGGSWTEQDIGSALGAKSTKMGGTAVYAQASGRTLSIAITSNNIVIGFVGYDSATLAGGVFKVEITGYHGGTLTDTIDTNNRTDGVSDGFNNNVQMACAKVYWDLGYTSHTVTITTLTANTTYIDYIGTLNGQSNCAPVYASLIPKMKATSYALGSGSGTNNGSAAAFVSGDSVIRIVVGEFQQFKYPVQLVPVNSYFNPEDLSQLDGDEIHPSDTGYAQIAKAFLSISQPYAYNGIGTKDKKATLYITPNQRVVLGKQYTDITKDVAGFGVDFNDYPTWYLNNPGASSDNKLAAWYKNAGLMELRAITDNQMGAKTLLGFRYNYPTVDSVFTEAPFYTTSNIKSESVILMRGYNSATLRKHVSLGTLTGFDYPAITFDNFQAPANYEQMQMYWTNTGNFVARFLNAANSAASAIYTINGGSPGTNYFRHESPVQLYGTGAATGAWKWLVKNPDSSIAYINKNEVTLDSMTIAGFNISGRGFGGAPSMTTSSFMTFFNSSNLVIYEGVGTGSTNYPKLRLTGSGSSAALIYSGIFEALNRAPASGSQPLLITTTGDAISTNFIAGNIILRPGTNSVVNTAASAQFTNDSVLVDLNGSGRMIIEDNDAKYNRNNGSIFTDRSLVDKGYVDSLTAISNGTSYTPTITSVTNVSGTTLKGARYYRHGSFVEVRVYVSIDPTSVGSTEIAISLPIASELAADDLFGSGNCGIAAQSGIVTTDATNNRATFIFSSTDTGAQDHVLIFSYPIILP